ncbi:hypothetical protein TNCV_1391641 [Trichonephila clavipes]|nr:hypothetical protein TNCV_1391641 [Trichonephila clavipes]
MSVVSRSFEHHAGDRAIWLCSNLLLRENGLGVIKGRPPLFPLHQPHEWPWARRQIRVTPDRNGAIHLQAPMSSPGSNPGTTAQQLRH